MSYDSTWWVKPALGVVGLTVFALTTCESQADKDAKAGTAESLIDLSNETCTHARPQAAEARLRDIFMDVKTKYLRVLLENDIRVCLDERLSKQNTGFFDREMYGIYYSGEIAGRSPGRLASIMTLWDNGKPLSEDSFFKTDASDWGPEIITRFAKAVKRHGLPPADADKIAAKYTVSCGRDCTTTEIQWRSVDRFDKDTVRKNHHMAQPPISRQW